MRKSIVWVAVCIMVASLVTVGLVACGSKSSSDPAPSATTYSISGTVTSSTTALQGVTLTLSGASTATATTDASGNYTFAGLSNGNYTLTPSKSGYTFNPASSTQTINSANSTGVNFTAGTPFYGSQLPLYDDFSSASIDSTKWVDNTSGTASIVNHQLQMLSNVTGSVNSSPNLRFTSSSSIQAMSADVTVTNYQITGGTHYARLMGAFYNDGTTGAAPGSKIGDIYAGFFVTDNDISYGVFRCLGSTSCSQTEQHYYLTGNGVNNHVSLANSALGQAHTLFMQWDGSIFTFQVDDNSPVFYDPKPQAPIVGSTPNVQQKYVDIRHTETDGQSGNVTATYDNIRAGAAITITP